MTMLAERIMNTPQNTPVRVGRERTCTQCGATYRSPRNSSRYCSNVCRMKAKRGTAPKADPAAGPDGFSVITKSLLVAGFVGPVTNASRTEALREDGIEDFHARSSEAVDLNRRQTRRRMEKQRAA